MTNTLQSQVQGRPVIVTCAVTGSIHTPSMSRYLPVSAQQVIDSAVEACQQGAAVLHLHARSEEDGRPLQTVEAFAPIVAAIRARCDAVINITTGGAPTMLVQERVQPAAALRPPLASLNMGSMNFGLYPMLERFKEFAHEWERPYLEGSRDRVFRNTFADIEYVLRMLSAQGTRFEFECYDIGHLHTLAHFADRGLVQGPLFIQGVFGLLGGIAADEEHVVHMRRTAERLFSGQHEFSALGAGRHQLTVARLSVALGGHVRVGLEDSLWIGKGELAQSNAQQVAAVRQQIEAAGHRLATPQEVRSMLKLDPSLCAAPAAVGARA